VGVTRATNSSADTVAKRPSVVVVVVVVCILHGLVPQAQACVVGSLLSHFKGGSSSQGFRATCVYQRMFTPRTMKSSQGPIKYVIGCLTRLKTTSIYTKEKMS
jgi:hypothetical protein